MFLIRSASRVQEPIRDRKWEKSRDQDGGRPHGTPGERLHFQRAGVGRAGGRPSSWSYDYFHFRFRTGFYILLLHVVSKLHWFDFFVDFSSRATTKEPMEFEYIKMPARSEIIVKVLSGTYRAWQFILNSANGSDVKSVHLGMLDVKPLHSLRIGPRSHTCRLSIALVTEVSFISTGIIP